MTTTAASIDLSSSSEAGDAEAFSYVARVVLAAASVGAGAIHLAMVMPHWQGSAVDGVTFAIAGWFQLMVAFIFYTKPTRQVLAVNVVVNLALIGGWAVSRTTGLPWGGHVGTAEEIGTADLVCVAFEALLIMASGVFAFRPRLGESLNHRSMVLTGAVPVALVMVLTTGALAAESSGGHASGADHHGTATETDHHATGGEAVAHGTGAEAVADHHGEGAAADDGHHGSATDTACADAHSEHHETMTDEEMADMAECAAAAPVEVSWEDRCDAEFNIASYWYEADASGVNAHSADAGASHHSGSGSHGMGEQEAARLVVELADATDEEYAEWLRNMNPVTRDPDAPDDTGAGGHMGPQTWQPLTDPEDCEALAADLDLAREVSTKYPTVADAKAAGYFMVAPYVPGIASHFMNFAYVDRTFNIEEPEMLLFDGNDDNAQVVGLSYYIIEPGEEQPDDGFAGNNDQYHRHIGLCMKNGSVIADTETTDEECAALGGYKSDGSAGWMSHAWVVPGCESPWGVFSAANPVLDRALIDNSGEGSACSGSSVVDRYDFTAGAPAETSDAP